MHIILTHEQSDFDALASLLGAHLLDEASIPILPRRVNRNVRAFVTLYGVELPFVEARDLPNEAIEGVTLVDTQSMISVRGMGPETKVQVVDHHPRRESLPPDWTITCEDTGANTTLFVEALRERDSTLSTVHATLLLAGIYEDTGSLTYTRTTPRDLNAAAYLLEHGASLQIVSSFLNHPLSLDQQKLYDRLRANAQTHHIHGHTIVIAAGDAQETDEELSTVAHKIRDLLDPDAFFLLVTLRGGVQMIARSTTEDIDVAQIATHFGGGGHERAAAGLIKEQDLQSVHAELLHILPTHVRPAITVAQIMSLHPQLLAPETPVAEAARRMQRYGYEGYPVVQTEPNGEARVIGLLTRRAVDRAISHKLNLTAVSLMDAGEHTVQPDDSIEHLQHLMTETGWGQIPVIHPQSRRIIGIVTRTDLLKTLTSETKSVGYQNLSGRLEAALPPTRLALLKIIAQTAYEQRAALYIVGGFVRDLLLDRPSLDFDLVVEGDAIELARALARRYGGRVTSHRRFGTAKWHLAGSDYHLTDEPPAALDFITARTEFYTYPTALPTVERGSIKLDLHRRDFTINTLALRLDGRHYGELHDYWGGLSDLRQRSVRVLHSLSFVDDPTRMLRAVRFEQRFDFSIEERTLQLLQEARPLLARVSGDRIRHELDHILDEDRAVQMITRLQALDLLAAIHTSLPWNEWLCSKLSLLQEPPPPGWELQQAAKRLPVKHALSYILWLIRLPENAFRSLTTRLKMPRALRDNALDARRLLDDLPILGDAPPSGIVTRLEDISPLGLYAVYLASDDAPTRQILQNYVSCWKHISPTTDGHALLARGLHPGPRFRQILAGLREAWLDGAITTPEEEQALLEKMLGS